MKKKIQRPRIPTISCPHCDGRSIVRDSLQVTPIYRELRLSCDNDDCGHTFLIGLSVIRTIRPSARPNPAVHLPFANPNLCAARTNPANDDAPVPANDDEHPVDPAAGPTIMGDSG